LEPVNSNDMEIWKWILTIIVGSISGMVTAAVTIGSLIYKLNTNVSDVSNVKKVLFKDSGGLNVMTESRHTEVCAFTMRYFEQDFDHIKDQMEKLEEKIDIVLSSAHKADVISTEDIKVLHNLMLEINKKVGQGLQRAKDSEVHE